MEITPPAGKRAKRPCLTEHQKEVLRERRYLSLRTVYQDLNERIVQEIMYKFASEECKSMALFFSTYDAFVVVGCCRLIFHFLFVLT